LLLLSRALLGFEGERDAEASALAQRALRELGPNDGFLEPELRATDALAARRDPSEAAQKIEGALREAWPPSLRVKLLLRRADARMALNDLRGSVRDARAARIHAPSAGERILGCFSLALALERSGDEHAAFEELRLARLLATSLPAAEAAAAGMSDLFVFRPLDTQYVAALRSSEAAVSADAPEEQLAHYERAIRAWQEFIRMAAPDDRWLPLARTHLARCEARRHELAEAAL
jgi:hypothetical protein